VIVHAVLFRPRSDVSAADTRALADALLTVVREVPGLRRIRVGPRVRIGRPYESLMRTDYTFAALLEFDDVNGLRAYLDHPAHAQLAARFFDAFEEALMYDFDLEEGSGGIERLTE
jgi:hypothetical protein